MPPGLAASATSLAELSGAVVDRAALLGRLLAALEAEVEGIEAGVSPLERYRAACSTIGRRVTVQSSDGRLSGIAVGLDATGALVVETVDGTVPVSAGEVTRVHPGDGR
jgi:BirA family biotin operon repressor/biotin-[acetyl-CoA-carboxylase] ligase